MNDHDLVTFRVISTPFNDFVLGRTRGGELRACWSHLGVFSTTDDAVEDDALEPDLASALTAYFDGDPSPLSPSVIPSHPPFFSQCWKACAAIPRGTSISYKELAKAAGSPLAFRAAGQAMKSNPLSVLVPCHRVKGTDGVGGYAGSTDMDSKEMKTKRFLLNLERPPSPWTRSTKATPA